MNTPTSLVWFITGTSEGFGRELVRAALERGDRVIATSRTPEKVMALFPHPSDQLLALKVDLCSVSQIKDAIEKAIETFGQIDVLINNAGHGLVGAIEEASEQEVLHLFQINFFALLHTIQTVLPHFRERRSGHIVNISSIWGLTSFHGAGIYNATKFAVEGLSQALAQEVKPLGIKVTIVEPGGFRTDFLAKPNLFSSTIIEDYAPTAGALRHQLKKHHGKQRGDTRLAAEAIIKAVTSPNPPLHLLLGPDAYEKALHQLDSLRQDFEAWQELSCSTDIKEA
ncbi:MAG: SDR family NAD(P)-dependent oxidoreductase [Chthoniobacterales bacterium]|nr:SDR family NAD(P)-dependent oxidoreductase [Chthoniobacterales bacterium]